jgi:hypothetical protein
VQAQAGSPMMQGLKCIDRNHRAIRMGRITKLATSAK